MDPVFSFWALSVVGACLFAASGFLFARAGRGGERDAPVARELSPTIDELAIAQEVIERRDRELAQAESVRAELESRLVRAEEAAKTASSLATELRIAKAAAQAQQEQQASVAERNKQEQELRRELALVRRALEAERKASQDLGLRVEALTKELADLTNERATLVADFEERSTREASVVADLQAKLASFEKQRAEDAAVMARLSVAPHAPASIDLASALLEHSAPTEGPMGDVFQGVVDRVARLDSVQSVAITDPLGFVVAGCGDHVDALAAFGAFIAEASTKAETLLPFQAACEVAVRSRNGSVLLTQALETPDLSIVLLASATDQVGSTRAQA